MQTHAAPSVSHRALVRALRVRGRAAALVERLRVRPIAELLALEPDARERLESLHLGYTEAPGSVELREAIAALYGSTGAGSVVALAAAEEGVFAVESAVLGPEDHAVVEVPCSSTRRTIRRGRRCRAVHDDLLERAERAPRGARAAAPGAFRRAKPRPRSREPRAGRRVRRRAHGATRLGAARRVADRLPRLRVPNTLAFCERLAAKAGVLLLPGDVYDQPGHVRFGLGRRGASEAFDRLGRFLAPA